MNGSDNTSEQATPLTGTSADGSLRFENRYPRDADGRSTGRAPTAWIWYTATGDLLAEGSTWSSSQVVPQPDGKWLLSMRHRNRDALFRLDPATRTFRTLGQHEPDERLGQLAAAIDRARKATVDKANTYTGLRLAPDESLRVDLASVEWSNTHWVNSPRVIEVATGRVLLDLWGSDWDAEPLFPRERCVSLGMQRYRSRISLRAVLDLASNSFTIDEQDKSLPPIVGPLADIAPTLEAASRRASAGAAQLPVPRRIGSRQLVVALLILIAALMTIGALSFVAVRVHPEPPQKLTPLPKMPDTQTPAAG